MNLNSFFTLKQISNLRLIFLLLCVLCLSPAVAFGQNQLITVPGTNLTLKQVFQSIESQTSLNITYSSTKLDVDRKVNGNFQNRKLSAVLDEVLAGTGYTYRFEKKYIVMVPVKKATSPTTKDGKRILSGSVKDGKDGEPLIGAVVRVKGDENTAALVDADGNFTINIDETSGKKPVLEISYIGYNKREVPIGDLNHVDVDMTGAANTLDEVIVVGSGTQKKVSVTGSISTVNGEALRVPSTTLSSALGGRVAGLITKQASGEPGTGSEFYIRGVSTFGGSATPLILLDDVEISASDLDYIPAENIESFTVLKDASATAIYGARGANGVMIVTTKGGDYNTKTKVNITVENTFNFLNKAPEYANGVDYMNFYNWVNEARNPGAAPIFSREKIEHTAAHDDPYLYPDVDWAKELMKKSSMRQHANLNVSGGGSRAKYYMSLDVQHEDGILNSDKLYSWDNNVQIYNYTFQNNISYKLTSSTRLSVNMNAQIRQTKSPTVSGSTVFANMKTTCNPVSFPVYWPNAADGSPRYGLCDTQQVINLKADLNKTFRQNKYATINAVAKLDQELNFITKGLKLNAWVNFKSYAHNSFYRTIDPFLYVYGGDYTETDGDYTLYIKNPDANQFITESNIEHSGNTTFEFQGNINWARKFGQHDLTAMLMYRMREFHGNKVLPNRNQGLSGRVTYDYAHRYLAEFNFGYNGTERLSKHHRFGFFPAASLGWVVSNEDFWQPISNVITHLKLRGSYGLVGSDDLASPGGSYFLYRDQIYGDKVAYLKWTSGNGDVSESGSGPVVKYYALTDVEWEKSRKLDVGFDMTLWGNLNITGEYFRENRYDIFMQRASWPSTLGYGVAVPYANVGKALNQGFEFSVNWLHRFNNETSASFQANFTYNANKYIYNDEPDYDYPWLKTTGRPLPNYVQYGYIAEGLYRSEDEIANGPVSTFGSPRVGDIKYRDLNGDGIVDGNDVTTAGSPTVPEIQYGIGATVKWRRLDFSFMFQGASNVSLRMYNMHPFCDASHFGYGITQYIADNHWSEDNNRADAAYPRLTSQLSSNNTQSSTFYIHDAKYLRLKTVELGYTIKKLRVYLSGNNLFVISPFDYWDPEKGGGHGLSYPLQRTAKIGVQYQF